MINSEEFKQLQREFLDDFSNAETHTSFYNFLDTLPFSVAILTQDRRVLFSNDNLLKRYGYKSIEQVLGKRPGEVMGCFHAHSNEDQCGISQNCKVCGALLTLKKTQVTLKPNNSEMHLTTIHEDSLVSHDLKISAIPMITPSNVYLMIYIEDISHEKRRKAIERIFFHDILNKVSQLNGIYELMVKNNHHDEKSSQFLDLMGLVLLDLTSEITSQRQLAAAENGELIVKMETIDLINLTRQLTKQFEPSLKENNNKFLLDLPENSIQLTTNATLLSRSINNLLKNAIEASQQNEVIKIKLVADEKIHFSISNSMYMIPEVQLQVFMRSFSTKGENRGLGTYSVKLLIERYLNGKVWFESSRETGTTFFIELPISNPRYAL